MESIKSIVLFSATSVTISIIINRSIFKSLCSFFRERKETDRPFRVILTGGPCGGKSTALSLLTTTLQKSYNVYTVPETSTILLSNGCSYPGLDNLELLLHYEFEYTQLQYGIENAFNSIAQKNLEINGKKSIILYDRGILDVKAYVTDSIWNRILDNLKLTEDTILSRYDLVCHLVSAADGASAFYSHETNSSRTESVEQAKALDKRTRLCWVNHKDIHVIDNSTTFDMKIAKCADLVLTKAQAFLNG